MKRLVKQLLLVLVVFGAIINSVYATDPDWTVHIKVSVPDSRTADGTVWNHLIAGVHEGATDGFDSLWDTLSMVEVDDPVQAVFIHGTSPEDTDNDGIVDRWICDTPEDGYNENQCSLWRDIRAFDGSKVWRFIILSTLNRGTVSLGWSFEHKPENIDVILVDLTDPSVSIDMKNISHYSYTNTFTEGKGYGIRYFEIRMEARGLFITPPTLPDATIGTQYSEILSAVGGIPVWSLEDGELPPGMFIDAYTGEIRGTPTTTGSYTFTVRCDDPVSGYSNSKEYTININSIPVINTTDLSDGVAGSEYMDQITVEGGSAPITWSISGNLPEGLVLDSDTGIISGRLVVPGIYDFTIIIKDANGAVDSRDLRITVIEPNDELPPGRIDDLEGIYISDTSVLLLWSAPADDSITGTSAIYDLRYMEGCSSAGEMEWDQAIEAIGEPRPQVGALQTYTLTGLKAGTRYCIAIKSMDAKGHVSEISRILLFPLSHDTGAVGYSEFTSSMILKKGYNLISMPLIPVPNIRDSLFGSVLGTPVALYRWYSAYPNITSPQYYLEDILMPGYGYFLYSPADDIRVSIKGLKIEETEYTVPLQNGWNMIGTPYNRSVLLKDIQVRNSSTDEMKTYIEAVRAGWIGNAIYLIESGNYDFASFNDDPPATLEPWTGYWIYVGAENGVEIIFKKQQ